MSDTYMGTDQILEMPLAVCEKHFGPIAPKETQPGPDKKLYMMKILNLISPEGNAMSVAKAVETVKKRGAAAKRAAVARALAAEYRGSDDEDDEDDEEVRIAAMEKRAKKTSKGQLLNAWNRMAVITRLGCHGLERHIPDSLATDDWVECCDPEGCVSEWDLLWDYDEDGSSEWEDIKVSKKHLQRFNRHRISLGREIGYSKPFNRRTSG